ncbi:selenocysteine-specific translation elongation factor [Paracoccus pacificus]|uniref:Selenocysteine-specific elongation factor n=1 Tax=Paracoccus pacificus TaxID=1463598 RepID=A0ABW4R6P3_9RHOB
MIVGTAGHIDHGKTALVRALTGVDADRLAEEKARGITIDLGFAYADLGGGAITGFVDVPGHERFVHTMLAGAGGIDLALLVVAADDGVMPQTREHLAILDLLGVRRGIVALTKSDLAAPDRTAEIAALLRGTGLADAPIMPVSSVTGQGIGALRAALRIAETETAERAASGRFRMVIDRSFTLTGAGTVVTGTVVSGQVAVGDQLVISPAGLTARVRGIHAQNRQAERALTGQRCALNLAGDGINKDRIRRGDVAVDPALHAPVTRIDAEFRLLASETKPVSTAFPAHLHCGAVEVQVRVVPLGDPIAPGQTGPVQLVPDRPIAASIGDRFILRDASARRTLGGGRLLDLRPPARHRRAPERVALRHAAGLATPAQALAAQAALGPVDLAVFARDRAMSDAQLADAAEGLAVLDSGHALSPGLLDALTEAVSARIAAYHETNPDHQGLGREKLRLMLTPRPQPPAFQALLRRMIAEGRVVAEGAFLRLPGHVVRLSAQDQDLLDRIEPLLSGEARFRPPRVRDFANDLGVAEVDVRRVLRMAARLGRVDQIAHDHFFARSTTTEMVAIIHDIARSTPDGWFGAPAFRDRVMNGRKVAIEILDFFDRHGLTQRRGDLRRVNPHRADLFGGFSDPGPET